MTGVIRQTNPAFLRQQRSNGDLQLVTVGTDVNAFDLGIQQLNA